MRWQAELEGEVFDLEELPKLFTAPDLRIVEEGGRYLLEAERLESLPDSGAVHAAARELLRRINGVLKLKGLAFREVDVGPIRELDEDGRVLQHAVILAATAEGRAKASAVLVKEGEGVPPPPQPGTLDGDKWLGAAAKNPKAARALELFGGSHDPTSLWKVWEYVRDSGIHIEPDQRRRFEPALNDRAVTGDAARHEESRKPVQPDTMSFGEAKEFVRDLLERWLSSLSPPP